MKGITRDLIQSKGVSGLVGVSVAFVASLIPFGTFVVRLSDHVWTQTETILSVLLMIGITIYVVADVCHIRLCARSSVRILEKRYVVLYMLGFNLYGIAVGCMVLGAGDLPALHTLVYASAAIFYTNRLFLLYPTSSKENLSYRDWTIFASIFLGELLVFGILQWFFYIGSV